MFIKLYNKITQSDDITVINAKLKRIEEDLVNVPIEEYAKVINELKEDLLKCEGLQLMQYIMDSKNENVLAQSVAEAMDNSIKIVKHVKLAYRRKGDKGAKKHGIQCS